jgi:hypothetical protein
VPVIVESSKLIGSLSQGRERSQDLADRLHAATLAALAVSADNPRPAGKAAIREIIHAPLGRRARRCPQAESANSAPRT